jgi:ABC-type phosphate transport system auxiliary subunit
MKSTEQVLTEIHIERHDLHQKIERLTAFIIRGDNRTSQKQFELLNHQLEAMKLYEFALTERIHNLAVSQ